MKKGICIGSLPSSWELSERFQLAKAAGFDGVEIMTTDSEEELRQMKALADSTGLEIPSLMGGLHWQYPLSDPDPEVRRTCSESFVQALSTASLVGADTVLLVPGVVNEKTTYEEAWDRALEEIRKLAPVAEANRVYLGIENVWNKFLLSPLEFTRFIDAVGSEYVQAYFDCGNILLYGYPQHWILSLGKRIKKIHVKDFIVSKRDFTYLLHGDVPWKAIREALQAIGYDDYITVELPPYPQCPEQMVYDSSRQLDRILEGF